MCYRCEKTHGLLIEGGLTYEDIKKYVADASIAFQDGVVDQLVIRHL
jgi:cytosolic 5'-nucleotidase 3